MYTRRPFKCPKTNTTSIYSLITGLQKRQFVTAIVEYVKKILETLKLAYEYRLPKNSYFLAQKARGKSLAILEDYCYYIWVN